MRLKTAERELLDPGFRRIWQPTAKADEPPVIPAGTGRLVQLKKGERITPRQVSVRQVVKVTPPVSEATLIRAMQTSGIGRPSTYAATLETLVSRGYVTHSEHGELHSTERGRAVCAFLTRRFPSLFALDFTAQMEAELDALSVGQATYEEILHMFWQKIQAEVNQKSRPAGRLSRVDG